MTFLELLKAVIDVMSNYSGLNGSIISILLFIGAIMSLILILKKLFQPEIHQMPFKEEKKNTVNPEWVSEQQRWETAHKEFLEKYRKPRINYEVIIIVIVIVGTLVALAVLSQ